MKVLGKTKIKQQCKNMITNVSYQCLGATPKIHGNLKYRTWRKTILSSCKCHHKLCALTADGLYRSRKDGESKGRMKYFYKHARTYKNKRSHFGKPSRMFLYAVNDLQHRLSQARAMFQIISCSKPKKIESTFETGTDAATKMEPKRHYSGKLVQLEDFGPM